MSEQDKQRFQELKTKFDFLGWLPYEDLLWLLAKLEELL